MQNLSAQTVRRSWKSLLAFLALCLTVQLVASLLTSLSVGDWYLSLRKPTWNPPGWVFGPVWTLLYLGMGVAAWRVWERRSEHQIRPALVLFSIQLLLNAVWSGLFFGLQMPMIAFWEIVLLWLAILVTLIVFWRADRVAGLIFVPYLGWVSFASALNLAIWKLNT